MFANDGYAALEQDGWPVTSQDMMQKARRKAGVATVRDGFEGRWLWRLTANSPVTGETVKAVKRDPRFQRCSLQFTVQFTVFNVLGGYLAHRVTGPMVALERFSGRRHH